MFDVLMENLMPKKTQSKPKAASKPEARSEPVAKQQRAATKHQRTVAKRQRKKVLVARAELQAHVSLKQRKRMIADALEKMVTNAPNDQRTEIAEHISDIGIDLIGLVHGLDASNAILMFPDDSITRLIVALDQHEKQTKVPIDTLIEQLLASLATGKLQSVFN